MVMNLSDYSTFASFNISAEINVVTFFDASDDYLLVVGTNQSFVYVIGNSTLYG